MIVRGHGPAGNADTLAEACPYAQCVARTIGGDLDAAGIVIGTTCDQMRRAVEDGAAAAKRPVCIMHVPATWQTGTARSLYRAELERLSQFLMRLGGAAPTQAGLQAAMQSADTGRSRLRVAREGMAPRAFAAALHSFFQTTTVDELPRTAHMAGVPVAVVGGPLLDAQYCLWDMIEASGGFVALDGTENGERTLPAPFDIRRMADDAVAELVRAYFDTIPDVFRRPDTLLHSWLGDAVAGRGIRGIVWVRHTWCDHWHAAMRRVKEEQGVPLLDLELGDSGFASDARTKSRIQAFLESLRGV